MSHKYKKEQIEFLNWEFGVFFHFGIRTFYEGHKDWDMQEMPLDGFKPTNLDCGQWMRVIKEAGAKYAILVCKHHDGFANWPSEYTEYSVKNTPWKGGKGDVVKEFTDACGEYGIKVGLYYSPAEFGSKDKPNKDYDDYFINQISELLTNYGKIDYLWFDGCGSENHQYDEKRIIKVIRGLQPNILIFNMWDPDTRWVGNESGYAHTPNYINVSSTSFSVQTETGKEDALDEEKFLPVECDFRMRLHNWFYSDRDEDTVKSLDELIGIYYYTVGRGANMLINIGPDRQGLLPEKDSDRLIEVGSFIKKAFSNPISSSFIRNENNGNSYICELENPALINCCVLKEDEENFDMVGQFSIKAYPYDYGMPITVYIGKTIGHKAICQFPPFYTKKIEVTVEKNKDSGNSEKTYLQEISLYFV
ncbi:MAG: alpha-L-fucosidase [Oscillospiraceae bacterium]|nr:alpha-L-fucosidase [Oscillospiraceae bacterium]